MTSRFQNHADDIINHSMAEFAHDDVIVRPGDPAEVTLEGIFDHAYVEISGGEVPVEGRRPVVGMRTEDVEANNIVQGTPLRIDGVDYFVVTPEPDGVARTNLILNEP